MNKWLVGALLLLLLSAVGCKSKRKMAEATAPESALATADQQFRKLLANDFSFEEMSFNMAMTAQMSDQKLSSPANVRMQRDQQIWISVKPMLGIEAFRVLIRPDSIFVVDRLNKQYLEQPFSWLADLVKAPLTYALLQDLLLNNVGFLTESKRMGQRQGQLLLSYQGLAIALSPAANGEKAALLQVNQNEQQLQVECVDWQSFHDKLLPKSLKLTIDGKQKGTIDINFSKFAVENGQSYPFSIPASYSKFD